MINLEGIGPEGRREGDGVRVVSKEVCSLNYCWWGTWTHSQGSASAVADATVTPSYLLAFCRMSCFSVFNYLVFTPNGVITPNCVLLHQNVYFFPKQIHLSNFTNSQFWKYIFLHREPVGGRNCFLGHGVTSGLLNRLLPLLFAVAAKSLGPGIWPLPVCSGWIMLGFFTTWWKS